jgi:hypothetical protein
MKKYNKITGLFFVLLVFITSCNEEFLERCPKDAISDAAYWTSEKDFKNYVNGFYGWFTYKNNWECKYGWENGTDNVMGFKEIAFPSNKIYRLSGDASQNDDVWNNTYKRLRSVNYFLTNKDKIPVEELTDVGLHYIGEAYFYRAYLNFTLLNRFGGAPYIDKVLNLGDDDDLYQPRMPRYDFAKKVMEDLDEAIKNLQWAGTSVAGSGRISKDAALGYKAKYALFEGSWEHYHKNTPFGVSGKDGSEFLNLAIDAANELIDHQGTNIFKGSEGKEYWDLHNQKDYSSIPGVLHYRVYSKKDGSTIKWANYARGGGQLGLTKSVVDDYLMLSGEPKEISADYQGDDNFVALTSNRDPRLAQTIYFKEKWGTLSELWDWPSTFEMAGVASTHFYYATPTGYYLAKGVLPDKNEYSNYGWGEQGLIYLRYAEVLYAYAEAKAILGTLEQGDIDKTINVIRDRVGMGHMQLSTVQGWESNPDYVKRYVNESAIINEIRRERRIELVGEGQRYDDLRRWRSFGELINGWIPKGAKAQQFLDYWGPLKGTTASDLAIDPDGYLVGGGFRSDFDQGGTGYITDEGRDYLYSIPKNQITLYKEKADVVLEQNPGWN